VEQRGEIEMLRRATPRAIQERLGGRRPGAIGRARLHDIDEGLQGLGRVLASQLADVPDLLRSAPGVARLTLGEWPPWASALG
jgi:hypothetical protein